MSRRDRPQSTEVDAAARGLYPRTDLADAWSVPLRPGQPTDAATWALAIFRDPPRWVAGALALRNRLVRLVGIPPGTSSAFDTIDVSPGGEWLLLGTDDPHLDFRSTIEVGRRVTLSTVARAKNRRGRAYLMVVRLVHPVVVRSMLARAARRLPAS